MKSKTKKASKVSKVTFDFERVLGQQLLNQLSDLVIYRQSKDSVCLFDQYTVERVGTGYQVSKMGVIDTVMFTSLKHAVCWCIYDKRNKIYDCSRIHELDRRYSSVNVDINIHTSQCEKYRKSKMYDLLDISLTKLSHDQQLLNQINHQLSRYLIESKRWQLNRFGVTGDK
jgi:hypothetical protein